MRDLCLLKTKEQNLYKVVDSRHDQDILVTSVDISPVIEEGYYGFVLRFRAMDFSIQLCSPAKRADKGSSLLYV